MRILVLGFTKIKYMPYMNFYIDNIDCEKNDVHVLYWNRDLRDEDVSKYSQLTFHEFRCYQEDDVSRVSKIKSFLKYRNFAKRIIRNGEYDFIIVLHSLTGVLVADILKKQFNDRLIFDYRDSTYEGFLPFRSVVAEIVKASRATFVSSDAFRRFLPDNASYKIFPSHNLLEDSLSHRNEKIVNGVMSRKIRIAFWGFIRHEKINKEIINKIAADDRFELYYYGKEQQIALNLKDYAEQISAKNIFFCGEYTPEDRYEFVRNTDIIHNIYCDSNTMLAMGNKYYDGLIFYLPQICMDDSFMGQAAVKAGIGFECNPYSEHFTDDVYNYYQSINKDDFYNSCDNELNRVIEEYNTGKEILKSIL